MTNPTQLIEQLVKALKRYRTETPLGHQPYLIAETVDGVLSEARAHLEQPTELAPSTAGERDKTIERLKYLAGLVWAITAEDKKALEHAAALLQSTADHIPDTGKMVAALPVGELTQRITDYLAGGGLFNPELANHDAVRDLLIDCREALAAARPQPVLEPLTVEAYTAIAHRTASMYEHDLDSTHVVYAFLPHTLDDFVRKIEAAHGITQRGKV